MPFVNLNVGDCFDNQRRSKTPLSDTKIKLCSKFDGRLRPGDYQTLIAHFRESRKDRLTIERESAREGSKLSSLLNEHGGPSWWMLYELPFVHLAALGCVVFGWTEKIQRFAQSENPPLEFVKFASSDDAELDPQGTWDDARKAACLQIVLAMCPSLEAVGLYGCSINELLEKAHQGDRKRLLDAMAIDRTAILTPTGAQLLSHAQLSHDRPFLNSVFKRMKEPRKKLRTYADLRLVTRLLVDAGDFASCSGKEIRALIDELDITSPPGVKELRDQMQRFRKNSTA